VIGPALHGIYYDGSHSGGLACSAYLDDHRQVNFHADGVEIRVIPVGSLSIPPRVGNTPRLIRLPDGACFETRDNDALDEILSRLKKRNALLNPHHWESKLKYMGFAVILLLAMTFGLIYFAVPAASNRIARALPENISAMLASNTLERLDDIYFSKTRLSNEKQESLKFLFQKYIPRNENFEFKLHFRHSETVGANALALPDGSIILTDDFVNLTNDNNEILAILFHEIGHIAHRHSLRAYIEAAGVIGIYTWLTGDLEGVSSIVLAAPLILIQAGYSRKHEWEADTYALDKMIEYNIDPVAFSKIMCKLHAAAGKSSRQKTPHEIKICEELVRDVEDSAKDRDADAVAQETTDKKHPGKLASELLDYLSTHPASEKRVRRFLEHSDNKKDQGTNSLIYSSHLNTSSTPTLNTRAIRKALSREGE
jgi:Zn-dependent protease with chaperone function